MTATPDAKREMRVLKALLFHTSANLCKYPYNSESRTNIHGVSRMTYARMVPANLLQKKIQELDAAVINDTHVNPVSARQQLRSERTLRELPSLRDQSETLST